MMSGMTTMAIAIPPIPSPLISGATPKLILSGDGEPLTPAVLPARDAASISECERPAFLGRNKSKTSTKKAISRIERTYPSGKNKDAARVGHPAASVSECEQPAFLPGAGHFFAGQLEASRYERSCWLKEQQA